MSLTDRVKTIIAGQGGTSFSYKRVTGISRNNTTLQNTVTYSTTTGVRGHVRKYDAKELAGLIQEGDRQLRIAASEVDFTPKKDDRIVFTEGEYNVVSVDTRSCREGDLIHVLTIRGSR